MKYAIPENWYGQGFDLSYRMRLSARSDRAILVAILRGFAARAEELTASVVDGNGEEFPESSAWLEQVELGRVADLFLGFTTRCLVGSYIIGRGLSDFEFCVAADCFVTGDRSKDRKAEVEFLDEIRQWGRFGVPAVSLLGIGDFCEAEFADLVVRRECHPGLHEIDYSLALAVLREAADELRADEEIQSP